MAELDKVIKEWEAVLSRDPLDAPWDLIDDTLALLRAQRKVIHDLCTLGYPHNFQREAPWVAQYCRDVSGVITEAFEVIDNEQ